jgi:FixJ family two-component response regulator
LKATACAEIPIIFITASKRTCLRRTAEKLGAVGFFEKPYDARELLGAVALILGAGLPESLHPTLVPLAARSAV